MICVRLFVSLHCHYYCFDTLPDDGSKFVDLSPLCGRSNMWIFWRVVCVECISDLRVSEALCNLCIHRVSLDTRNLPKSIAAKRDNDLMIKHTGETRRKGVTSPTASLILSLDLSKLGSLQPLNHPISKLSSKGHGSESAYPPPSRLHPCRISVSHYLRIRRSVCLGSWRYRSSSHRFIWFVSLPCLSALCGLHLGHQIGRCLAVGHFRCAEQETQKM